MAKHQPTLFSSVPLQVLVLFALLLLSGFLPALGESQNGDNATIIFVDQNAPGHETGTNWENAFTSLQDALDVVSDGMEIWVAAGMYHPEKKVGGEGPRYKTFQLINGVRIYGGFQGDENPEYFNLKDRDFDANETILSGDLDQNDIAGDFSLNRTDNVLRVIYHPGSYQVDDSALLDGFTISGGHADLEGDDQLGVPGNQGGGILHIGYDQQGKVMGPEFKNITVTDNFAAESGGGIQIVNADDLEITNAIVSGNKAGASGGGLNIKRSGLSMINGLISGNKVTSANGSGAGARFSDIVDGIEANLVNITISGNYSEGDAGGLIHFTDSDSGTDKGLLKILNSIVIGNQAADGDDDLIAEGPLTNMIADYSAYSSSISRDGATIFSTNPQMGVDPDQVFLHFIAPDAGITPNTDGNYRLMAGAQVIDFGINTPYESGGIAEHITSDLDGNLRIQDGTEDGDAVVDMGAYEFPGVEIIVYYSRKSGKWQAADSWTLDETHDGEPAPDPPDRNTRAEIAANHTIWLDADVHTEERVRVNKTGGLQTGTYSVKGSGSFVLESGGILKIGSSDGISRSVDTGAIQTSNRSFSSEAKYVYNGAMHQVTGTGLPVHVASFTIDNSEGVEVTSDLITQDTLHLLNGTLTIRSGNNLIANDKVIPEQHGGSLRFLRELSGSKGWRLLSSPVETDFADFTRGPDYKKNGNKVVTQGFDGSDFPDEMPNILYYAEDIPGDTVTTNMGWRTLQNEQENLIPGRGYFVYVFDGAGGLPGDNVGSERDDSLPFSVSASGQENEPVNSPAGNDDTFFEFDVSFTARKMNSDDQGWNLVGNPFGATLDWDADGWVRKDMHQAIYIWDPAGNDGRGEYRYWNGVTGNLGSGQHGEDNGQDSFSELEKGKIAPFQAFWVKAESEESELSVSADAKTTGGRFLGKKIPSGALVQQLSSESSNGSVLAEVLNLYLKHKESYSRTEAQLMFSRYGSSGKDTFDAYRLIPLSDNYLSLYTYRGDGSQLSVNSLPDHFDDSARIPLNAHGVVDGTPLDGETKLSWDLPDNLSNSYSIWLVDRNTGKKINMKEQADYSFYLESAQNLKSKLDDIASVDGFRKDSREHLSESMYQVNQPGKPLQLKRSASNDESRFYIDIQKLHKSEESNEAVPNAVILKQNYPNPFNPVTNIQFGLHEESYVRVAIYDVMGRRVAVLADGMYQRGMHELSWNAKQFASGTYIYRLVAGNDVRSRKMMLVK